MSVINSCMIKYRVIKCLYTVNQTLILSEDLFLLKNTCFGDGNFRTNLHDNITLIISAIAARDKLAYKNLVRDE